MTDELRSLMNEISAELQMVGFTKISAIDRRDQLTFADVGKYDPATVHKSGKTIDVEVCGTHNEKIEPVSVYVRSLTWDHNSTVSKRCKDVKISWKFSEKKKKRLLNEIIEHYRES